MTVPTTAASPECEACAIGETWDDKAGAESLEEHHALDARRRDHIEDLGNEIVAKDAELRDSRRRFAKTIRDWETERSRWTETELARDDMKRERDDARRAIAEAVTLLRECGRREAFDAKADNSFTRFIEKHGGGRA